MKDVIVIYKSKYGAAKQYAQWIAEELGCEAVPVKQVTSPLLQEYRMIVFGGGLYMGRINGVAALTRRFAELKEKTLFIFTAGLTEPGDDGYYTYLYTRNFTEKMRKKMYFFAFPGAVDPDKMGWFHRSVMKMAMEDRAKKDPANASAYREMKIDLVDRKYIEPLVTKAKWILNEWEQKKRRQQELREQAQKEAEAAAVEEIPQEEPSTEA